MTKNYIATSLENKWQEVWKTKSFYAVEESLSKSFYCLSMLPYPSGELHMGHVRNYTIGDVISRYKRMQGYNVLQPIGWDAFGLPAENAAINGKVSPSTWTNKNIANMRKQLAQLGLAYDWHREITTCVPEYYKWNQWLFLKMYEKGLVYQKQSSVNWDPVDCTVLANEQVVDGRGWRSGAVVEKKNINQWFFKITDYAEELLSNLDKLDKWPEQVKIMQKNWIGKSVGHNVKFKLYNIEDTITVFTSRVDTLYGVTFIAVAPEHEILQHSKSANIESFKEQCKLGSMAEADIAKKDKIGFDTGLYAINPANNKKVPIFVTNYVLMSYGTGAVMGVPAHDERDNEFAKSQNLPIIEVIQDNQVINSGDFNGLNVIDAKNKIGQAFAEENTTYRLRDWGISRQRYWGTPIPIVYCDKCGTVPVKEKSLPVILPCDLMPSNFSNTLKESDDFVNTTCPICENPAKRETDTMDTFVDSSWYYARYTCPDQNHVMLDERAKYWTPVDQYIGGIEHATMHLLYARFIHKVLRDIGLVNSDEPFSALLTQGMVLLNGSKMSKSKGNTISPKDIIEKYGADTVRLFSMFAAPPEQALEWQEGGIDGSYRFLNKLWTFAIENLDDLKVFNQISKNPKRTELHKIIKQALNDYDRMQFNTVVSACMKIMKLLDTNDMIFANEAMKYLLALLHPICPHITMELWQKIGYKECLTEFGELKIDESCISESTAEIVVQVNGKTRGRITCNQDESTEKIFEICLNESELAKYLANKQIKKTIHLKNKLVNFVV